MTPTDILLAVAGALLAARIWQASLQHAELVGLLNALAEMIGEEIDRRKHDG